MRCHNRYEKALAAVVIILIFVVSLSGCSENKSVEELRASGDVEGLIEKLTSPNSNTRAEAAEALGEIKDERAIVPLVETLKEDEDSTVKQKASEAVAKIGNANEALPPLIEALKHNDWRVRYRAADALGKIGDPRAAPGLIKALDDSVKDVRQSSAWALGEIGDQRAVNPLLENIKHDESQDVREEAKKAIKKLGRKSVDSLIAALDDDDVDVRNFAAQALGEIGSARGVPRSLRLKIAIPLIGSFNDSNADVRLQAANSLDRLGYTPRNESEEAWYLVAKKEWNKATFKGELAIDPLINALTGDDSKTKWSATKALVKIGPAAVDPLIQTLNSRGTIQAAIALEIIGTPPSEEIVNQFIQSYNANLTYIAQNYVEIIENQDIKGREFLLILALERYGDYDMVNVFLKSENQVLNDAAGYWAERHGNVISESGNKAVWP